MNINSILSEIANGDTSFNNVKEVLSKEPYHMSIGEYSEENAPELYNIRLTDKSPRDNDLIVKMNGIILTKDANEVISYTYPYAKEFMKCKDLREELDTDDLTDYKIIQYTEGDRVTLYYYNNKWNIASTNSFNILGKAKTFFWESLERAQNVWKEKYPDESVPQLNTDYTYTFMVCLKDKYRISNYSRDFIVHIGKWNVKEQRQSSYRLPYLGSETTFEMHTFHEFVNSIKSLNYADLQNYNLGYILEHTPSQKRYKIFTSKYSRMRKLQNNNALSLSRRYFSTIRKHTGDRNFYLKYFPQARPKFDKFDQDFEQLVHFVYEQYTKYFIRKERNERLDKELHVTIRELHKEFIDTSEKRRPKHVRKYLNSIPGYYLYPFLKKYIYGGQSVMSSIAGTPRAGFSPRHQGQDHTPRSTSSTITHTTQEFQEAIQREIDNLSQNNNDPTTVSDNNSPNNTSSGNIVAFSFE